MAVKQLQLDIVFVRFIGDMKERGNLKDLGVAGRLILKHILSKTVGKTLSRFS
jgi:hypothetical protein